GPGADDFTGLERDAVTCAFDDLGESATHVLEIAARDLLSVDGRFHAQIMALSLRRANREVVELITRDEDRSKRGGKIFSFSRPQIELHLFHLQDASRPIVHDHVAKDMLVGARSGNVPPGLSDDYRHFEFKIQFL